MTTPFLDGYSSEDYEDCDEYFDVPAVSQITQPIDESHDNEALMIEWPEVTTTPRSNQVILSSESDDDDDDVPNMENEVEESDSKAVITTGAPASSLTALTVVNWTSLEGTRVLIHRRQDLGTMLSGSSSPAFICSTILKNWIEQFLLEIARFRIRFYRSIAAAFRKVAGWATCSRKSRKD